MSLIAIGMNAFLAVLMLAALAMGWRLDRRLRNVRDSQALFAKAIKDLDASTEKARAGLAELRAATDEAIDLLGGRIVRAKECADRLDRSISHAEAVPAPRAPATASAAPSFERRLPEMRAPERRAPEKRPLEMRPLEMRPVEMRPLETRMSAARAPEPRAGEPVLRRKLSPTDLHGLLELAETGRINGFAPLRAPQPQRPAPTPRMRPADEDLFDDIGALR